MVEIATWPVRDVFVASLILAIEVELNTSRPTIAPWKARFEKNGIGGLEGRHKVSKPHTITAAVQAKVCAGPRRNRMMEAWKRYRATAALA